MKALASYIMKGRSQAVLVTVALAVFSFVIPPLSLLSAAAVALVTLRLGPMTGLGLMALAGLVMAGVSYAALGQFAFGLVVAAALWGPVWLLAIVLRGTRSLPIVVMVAGAVGVMAVLVVHATIVEPMVWWHTLLKEVFDPALQQSGMSAEQQAQLQSALTDVSKLMTGLVGGGLALNALICLFVGRSWQAGLYNPGGFRQEFHQLRLGRSLALVTLGVMLLALLPAGGMATLAGDVAVVLLSLYMLQGVAIAHALAALKGLHQAWLIALYVLLLFAMPQMMTVLALVGVADTWVDIRKRMAPGRPQD